VLICQRAETAPSIAAARSPAVRRLRILPLAVFEQVHWHIHGTRKQQCYPRTTLPIAPAVCSFNRPQPVKFGRYSTDFLGVRRRREIRSALRRPCDGTLSRSGSRRRRELREVQVLIEVTVDEVDDEAQTIAGQATAVVLRCVLRSAVATREIYGNREAERLAEESSGWRTVLEIGTQCSINAVMCRSSNVQRSKISTSLRSAGSSNAFAMVPGSSVRMTRLVGRSHRIRSRVPAGRR
jgi:hypothetical protein